MVVGSLKPTSILCSRRYHRVLASWKHYHGNSSRFHTRLDDKQYTIQGSTALLPRTNGLPCANSTAVAFSVGLPLITQLLALSPERCFLRRRGDLFPGFCSPAVQLFIGNGTDDGLWLPCYPRLSSNSDSRSLRTGNVGWQREVRQLRMFPHIFVRCLFDSGHRNWVILRVTWLKKDLTLISPPPCEYTDRR
jgi:hypothetical protein